MRQIIQSTIVNHLFYLSQAFFSLILKYKILKFICYVIIYRAFFNFLMAVKSLIVDLLKRFFRLSLMGIPSQRLFPYQQQLM